jgi:hypothetical protein
MSSLLSLMVGEIKKKNYSQPNNSPEHGSKSRRFDSFYLPWLNFNDNGALAKPSPHINLTNLFRQGALNFSLGSKGSCKKLFF